MTRTPCPALKAAAIARPSVKLCVTSATRFSSAAGEPVSTESVDSSSSSSPFVEATSVLESAEASAAGTAGLVARLPVLLLLLLALALSFALSAALGLVAVARERELRRRRTISLSSVCSGSCSLSLSSLLLLLAAAAE